MSAKLGSGSLNGGSTHPLLLSKMFESLRVSDTSFLDCSKRDWVREGGSWRGSVATRLFQPVRRCLRGLVESVSEEAVLAVVGAPSGVEGRELFDQACDDERRFGAIVVDRARRLQRLQSQG